MKTHTGNRAVVLKNLKVNIREQEVLRLQGFKGKKEQPSGKTNEALKEAIETGYTLIQPQAVHKYMRVQEIKGGILLLEEGLHLNVGSDLWEGAEYLALALCTIGPLLEKKVSELFYLGEYTSALLLDSVGSVAVENIADQLNYLVCQKGKKLGMGTSPRLSPGYGKWSLEDQKVIFSLLPGEKIGIYLNEHFMMIPRKSISFGISLKRNLTSNSIKRCHYCNLENCHYRS